MANKAGDVVLVPFPFRDQLAERTRPAVVLSASIYNQQGDLVVGAITSHSPRHKFDYALVDWKGAGLMVPSTVRMIFATIADIRVVRQVGKLMDPDWDEVKKRVLQVFAWP